MKLISISGLARSGKDTLCQMFIDEFNKRGKIAKRYALADRLKAELYYTVKQSFNLDIFNLSDEEKILIRPLMVAWGKIRRQQTGGKYFTEKLSEKLQYESVDYAIVTDCRYTEFGEDDEIGWVRKNNGTLIHISRILDDGSLLQPPNEDEAKNDPILRKEADYKLQWRSLSSDYHKIVANADVESIVNQLL